MIEYLRRNRQLRRLALTSVHELRAVARNKLTPDLVLERYSQGRTRSRCAGSSSRARTKKGDRNVLWHVLAQLERQGVWGIAGVVLYRFTEDGGAREAQKWVYALSSGSERSEKRWQVIADRVTRLGHPTGAYNLAHDTIAK